MYQTYFKPVLTYAYETSTFTELPKDYARLQTAVARGLGLPADYRVRILMLLPNTHSVISIQFPRRWSCALMYICKTETLVFTDCDYC